MADMTFEEVVEAVNHLTPAERMALARHIEITTPVQSGGRVTREQLIAELDALRAAGAFENVESLYGKYANPAVEVSEEELNDYLRQIGKEWEAEMDELADT